MSEVANCPLCGQEPYWYGKDSYSKIGITCCGHTIWTRDNPTSWNRYAAAMELARAVLRLHNDDTKTAHQWEFFVEEAEKRVLEVWK